MAIRVNLRAELETLTSMGIAIPITKRTRWVSSLLCPEKTNKSLRICIDPKDLNEATVWSHFPLQTVDDLIPRLSKAKIFSDVDARNGFWHVRIN